MPVKEWDDLDDIKHQVRLLRAANKIAKEPTTAIIAAEQEQLPTRPAVSVYEDYMDEWPECEY